MITVNYEMDITGAVIALEVIVPDNARSSAKPLLVVAQQGSQLSSYFTHITYETLSGEGYLALIESGIRKADKALSLHYAIPMESSLLTKDGFLHISVLSGFLRSFSLFEALAHFTIQPFIKGGNFTMTQQKDSISKELNDRMMVLLPTRFKKNRRDFVAVHQPFNLDPEDFLLLDFDPNADDIVCLPPREMGVSMETN